MRGEIILDCCSYEAKTGTKTYEYIECFKLKPGKKFFKKKIKGRQGNKKRNYPCDCLSELQTLCFKIFMVRNFSNPFSRLGRIKNRPGQKGR